MPCLPYFIPEPRPCDSSPCQFGAQCEEIETESGLDYVCHCDYTCGCFVNETVVAKNCEIGKLLSFIYQIRCVHYLFQHEIDIFVMSCL